MHAALAGGVWGSPPLFSRTALSAGPGFTPWRLLSENPRRVPPGRKTSGTPGLGSLEDKGDLGTRGREREARGPGCRGDVDQQRGSREERREPRPEQPQNAWDGRGARKPGEQRTCSVMAERVTGGRGREET